ncbi:helix-turn-helix domain-containing protein [Asticcacaulis aquaticus]|uniref:helix-turn-helix domain-containing protein n=1 Tax=Asticcacaulis aquaticus TaxID=2984212 RepID=UPI0034A538A6
MKPEAILGWNLRRIRLEKNFSQEEVAFRLGTADQKYISRIESGDQNITCRTAFRLAAAICIDPSELFDTTKLPHKYQSLLKSLYDPLVNN